jgi:hypothetical protein
MVGVVSEIVMELHYTYLPLTFHLNSHMARRVAPILPRAVLMVKSEMGLIRKLAFLLTLARAPVREGLVYRA